MNKKIGHYLGLTAFLFVLFGPGAFSQDIPAQPRSPARITITGTVSDSTGRKIEGASVVVAQGRKNNGTTTDANGRFILDVEPGSPLLITYVGYAEQRIIASSEHRSVSIVLRAVAAGEAIVVTA